jgi:MarR family transcriptional regulator for hemolysin
MENPTLAAGMRLQRAVVALLRRFEYRDRSQICCHGISVTQCHTLEAVVEHGEPTMGELAARLFVSVSTMTRIVDGLERQGLVERKLDLKDRRAWRVLPTAAGRALADRIRGEQAAGAAAVLAKIEEQHRESVIFAVEELTRAVDAWRSAATAEGGCCGETST